MICPSCGNENVDGSKFCIKCGTSLVQPVESNVSEVNNVVPEAVAPVQQNTIASFDNNVKSEPVKKQIKMPNVNVKVVGIVLAAILVVIGGYFGVSKLFQSTSSGKSIAVLDKKFNPDRPIKIKVDSKYGYIKASNGEMLIAPQYDYAYDFYGDYALVKIKGADELDYAQIIDKKGKVIKSGVYSLKNAYIEEYDCWLLSSELYDSKLNKINADGELVIDFENGYFSYINDDKKEVGVYSVNGKKIFSTSGKEISIKTTNNIFDEDDNYLFVDVDDKHNYHVFYTKNNKEITSLKLDKYFSIESGTTIVKSKENSKANYYFFIDGQLAYQNKEDLDDLEIFDYTKRILKLDYGYSYSSSSKKSRYSYYDVKNKKTLKEAPTSSASSKEIYDKAFDILGFVTYEVGSSYGVMSKDKVLLPAIYESIDYLDRDVYDYVKYKTGKQIILATLDDKVRIINMKNQKELMVFEDDSVSNSGSTFIKVKIYDDSYNLKNTVIYNLLTDKSMTFGKNEEVSVNSNYITVSDNKKVVYYNTKLEKIYEGK